MSLKYTEKQKIVNDELEYWFYEDSKQILKLSGYAGTGKTTLITNFGLNVYKKNKSKRIYFTAFTGKATIVLNEKLNNLTNSTEIEKYTNYSITTGTMHSLMYIPKYLKTIDEFGNESVVLIGWKLRDPEDIYFDLIIIDEASMLTSELFNDICKFGNKILLVGDNFQLPPVGKDDRILNNPDLMLDEIIRYSDNYDILRLSENIRKSGDLEIPKKSNTIRSYEWTKKFENNFFKLNFSSLDNCVLCAFNKFRVLMNKKIRENWKFKEDIVYPGEKLICLKNAPLFKNGQIVQVLKSSIWDEKLIRLYLISDLYDYQIEVMGLRESFNTENFFKKDIQTFNHSRKKKSEIEKYCFDFGYVISVHKSQGSEFDNVILFNQQGYHWDEEYKARWLYTAVTRARKKIIIIENI